MLNIKRINFYWNQVFATQCTGTEPDFYLSKIKLSEIRSRSHCEVSALQHQHRQQHTFSLCDPSSTWRSSKCRFFGFFLVYFHVCLFSETLLCRANYWYINIYNLGLNTVLNIVLPIASLVILNILIFRYVNPSQ